MIGARVPSYTKNIMKSSKQSVLPQQFLDYVNASPSPYHAVKSSSLMLEAAGYKRLSEADESDWSSLPAGGKYYFTRNQSTLFAFAIGGAHKPGNGISIVAAHTDSPVLRVKPVSNVSKAGMLQLGVATYGGGLWNTWFDRDLSIAGRVIVASDDGLSYHSRLVKIDRSILRIPSLAIHLNREIREKGFQFNTENQLAPLLTTIARAKLNGGDTRPDKNDENKLSHSPILLDLIAHELNIKPDSIRDFQLSLYDTQPSAFSGPFNEFIVSPRLDNLMMAFCSLRSLLDTESSLQTDKNVRLIALFDHEEIGSKSAQGAASNMMSSIVKRLTTTATLNSSVRKSFLISADMAHAWHPNYLDKHEDNHRPHMNQGVVIKNNCNQRYATDAVSAFIIKEIAKRRCIPIQQFVVRNDMGCGSTIGPDLSSNTGIRTVDIGIAQLAMHSIRETCGVDDVQHGVSLLAAFFEGFTELDESIHVDV